MSDIVDGFKNMVWVIRHHESLEEKNQWQLPFSEHDRGSIEQILQLLACTGLSPREVMESPQFFQVQTDEGTGSRVTYSAGENPHFTATLYRQDELAS